MIKIYELGVMNEYKRDELRKGLGRERM